MGGTADIQVKETDVAIWVADDPPGPGAGGGGSWKVGAGRHCAGAGPARASLLGFSGGVFLRSFFKSCIEGPRVLAVRLRSLVGF